MVFWIWNVEATDKAFTGLSANKVNFPEGRNAFREKFFSKKGETKVQDD